MKDIDQSRFALITALTRAHKARSDEYPNPGTLVAMSDECLYGYATALLHSLKDVPRSNSVEAELQEELRRILETP
jgi:hypothetical protein